MFSDRDDIPSKWEYIRNVLYNLGYINLAKKAHIIEQHLQLIYGDTKTDTWEDKFKHGSWEKAMLKSSRQPDNLSSNDMEVFLLTLEDITKRVEFCIGCEMNKFCATCRYGDRYELCKEIDSEFTKFLIELDRERRSYVREV